MKFLKSNHNELKLFENNKIFPIFRMLGQRFVWRWRFPHLWNRFGTRLKRQTYRHQFELFVKIIIDNKIKDKKKPAKLRAWDDVSGETNSQFKYG